MLFDPNISLGSLAAGASTVVSVIVSYVRSRAKLESLTQTVNELKGEVVELRKSDKDQAVLTQRVLALETEAKVSSLAALVQRVNYLEKEISRLQETESFRTKNIETVRR